MQPNAIRIEGIEIEFYPKRLKFRDQERVIDLVSEIAKGGNPKQQAAAIREAIGITIEGWSKDAPFDQWDSEIDLVQAVKLVHASLGGNQISEVERKKSELPHS